jgi:hypothetical protein
MLCIVNSEISSNKLSSIIQSYSSLSIVSEFKMRRVLNFLRLIIFYRLLSTSFGDVSEIDLGAFCIIKYLKTTGKIPVNFPDTFTTSDSVKCELTTPIMIRSLTSLLCGRLLEVKTENVDCVMQHLVENRAIDFIMILDVAVFHVQEDEVVKELKTSTENKFKEILVDIARICESDPNYGGLFDKLMGFENDILIAIEQKNYCFAKFAIESELIKINEEIDLNPKKISTFDIDCKSMIIQSRREREENLIKKLRSKRISNEQIQCILDKYQIERAFDAVIALEVISNLNISATARKFNLEKVNSRFINFVNGVIMCSGSLEKISSAKISDTILLIQH